MLQRLSKNERYTIFDNECTIFGKKRLKNKAPRLLDGAGALYRIRCDKIYLVVLFLASEGVSPKASR